MRRSNLVVGLVLLMSFSGTRAASAGLVKQTLINGSGKVVNDLHLSFTKGFIDARTKVVVTRLADGMSWSALPTNASKVEFPTTNFGEISRDALDNKVSVKFLLPELSRMSIRIGGDPPPTDRARIDVAKTEWTRDGNGLGPGEGVFTRKVTLAAYIDPDTHQGFVQLFNDSDQNMLFSNIGVSANNSLTNYNLESFDVATGSVDMLAPILVGPNQVSDPISLGVIDPSKYELITATANDSSGLGETVELAAALAIVPEPSSLILAMTGLVLVTLVRHRQFGVGSMMRRTLEGRTRR